VAGPGGDEGRSIGVRRIAKIQGIVDGHCVIFDFPVRGRAGRQESAHAADPEPRIGQRRRDRVRRNGESHLVVAKPHLSSAGAGDHLLRVVELPIGVEVDPGVQHGHLARAGDHRRGVPTGEQHGRENHPVFVVPVVVPVVAVGPPGRLPVLISVDRRTQEGVGRLDLVSGAVIVQQRAVRFRGIAEVLAVIDDHRVIFDFAILRQAGRRQSTRRAEAEAGKGLANHCIGGHGKRYPVPIGPHVGAAGGRDLLAEIIPIAIGIEINPRVQLAHLGRGDVNPCVFALVETAGKRHAILVIGPAIPVVAVGPPGRLAVRFGIDGSPQVDVRDNHVPGAVVDQQRGVGGIGRVAEVEHLYLMVAEIDAVERQQGHVEQLGNHLVIRVVQRQRIEEVGYVDVAIRRNRVEQAIHQQAIAIVERGGAGLRLRVDFQEHVEKAVDNRASGHLVSAAPCRRCQADRGGPEWLVAPQIQVHDFGVDVVIDAVEVRIVRRVKMHPGQSRQLEDPVTQTVEVEVEIHAHGGVETDVAGLHAVEPIGIRVAGDGRVGRGGTDDLACGDRDQVAARQRCSLLPADRRIFEDPIRPWGQVFEHIQALLGDRVDSRLAIQFHTLRDRIAHPLPGVRIEQHD